MLFARSPPQKITSTLFKSAFAASFKKFNYEDGLNLTSLLNDEELMVITSMNVGYRQCQEIFRNSSCTQSY